MKRCLGILVVTLLAGPAQSAVCATLTDAARRLACYDDVARCVAHDDADDRLACYDSVHAPAGVTPAPSIDKREDAEPQRAEDSFPVAGKTGPDKDPAPLVATIEAVQQDPRGVNYLTLDNGQIWRELRPGRIRFETGSRVEISSGIFGSVNLKVLGSVGYVKVRRVE